VLVDMQVKVGTCRFDFVTEHEDGSRTVIEVKNVRKARCLCVRRERHHFPHRDSSNVQVSQAYVGWDGGPRPRKRRKKAKDSPSEGDGEGSCC
jgi:hypothetical protein